MGSPEESSGFVTARKKRDSSPEPLTITHTNRYILIHQPAKYLVKPLLRYDGLD